MLDIMFSCTSCPAPVATLPTTSSIDCKRDQRFLNMRKKPSTHLRVSHREYQYDHPTMHLLLCGTLPVREGPSGENANLNMLISHHDKAYLNSGNLYVTRIPALPLPAFHAHGAERQQTDSSVTFTNLDTVLQFWRSIFIRHGVINPTCSRHRKFCQRCKALGRIMALRLSRVGHSIVVNELPSCIPV
jgi:hypothetical protein